MFWIILIGALILIGICNHLEQEHEKVEILQERLDALEEEDEDWDFDYDEDED